MTSPSTNTSSDSGKDLMINECENMKRTDYLEWDEYFVAAMLLSQRRCQIRRNRQSAALLVNKRKQIIAYGCNGHDNNDNGRACEVDHAVRNAVIAAKRRHKENLHECTAYSVYRPCRACANDLINVGVTQVVYLLGDDRQRQDGAAGDDVFDNLHYRKFVPEKKRVHIDFSTGTDGWAFTYDS